MNGPGVLVVTPWWDGFVQRQVLALGRRHHVAVKRVGVNGLPRFIEAARATWTGLNGISEYSTHHAYGAWPAGLTALELARGRRLVVHEHLSPVSDVRRYLRWTRPVYERAHAVVSPSATHATALAGIIGRGVAVVPNPVLVERQPLPATAPHRPMRFLSYGRFVSQKGFDAVVRAAAAMPEASFTLMGRGPQALFLRRMAPRNVSFMGWREDPTDVMHAFDAVLCPSRHESFGLACAEAVAMGLPVVASDVGEHENVVCDAGVVLEDGEPLLSGITRLESGYDRMRKAAARRAWEVREEWSERRFVDGMSEVYGERT